MEKTYGVKKNNALYVAGALMYLFSQAVDGIASKVFPDKNAAPVKKAGKYSNGKTAAFRPRRKIAWYWDVRMWLPVFAMILVLAVVAARKTAVEVVAVADADVVEMVQEEPEELVAELSIEDANEIAKQEMAVELARLADSVAGHRSDDVKKAIMWVAINRSEDGANGYGRPLLEEIERPRQWQNYDPEAVYLESTYNMAEEIIDTWLSGGARMFNKDMLWFVLNGDGSITVRNRYGNEKNRAEATLGQ